MSSFLGLSFISFQQDDKNGLFYIFTPQKCTSPHISALALVCVRLCDFCFVSFTPQLFYLTPPARLRDQRLSRFCCQLAVARRYYGEKPAQKSHMTLAREIHTWGFGMFHVIYLSPGEGTQLLLHTIYFFLFDLSFVRHTCVLSYKIYFIFLWSCSHDPFIFKWIIYVHAALFFFYSIVYST